MIRFHYFFVACISFLVFGSVYSLDRILLAPEEVRVMLPPELSNAFSHNSSYFSEELTYSSLTSPDLTCLFGINFVRNPLLHLAPSSYILEFLNELKLKTVTSAGVSKYTWNVIEQNNFSAIYEYLIHGESPNTTISHDISRIIFTEYGVHTIHFASDRGKLSDKERGLWIKILRDSVSVVKNPNGSEKKRETPAEKLQESINLGCGFTNWKVAYVDTTSQPDRAITRLILKNETDLNKAKEILDVTTFSDIQQSSLSELFQKETTEFSELVQQPIVFKILKQSNDEIISTCSYEMGGTYFQRGFKSDC